MAGYENRAMSKRVKIGGYCLRPTNASVVKNNGTNDRCLHVCFRDMIKFLFSVSSKKTALVETNLLRIEVQQFEM